MMWHYRMGFPCDRCSYWDDIYQQHLAKVSPDLEPVPEVTDEEMLEIAEPMDGTNE